jgi:CHAP domain.
MTTQDFLNQFNGRYVDFDGAFGNQCVDLVQFYNRDVVGNSIRFIGNAKDLYSQTTSFYTQAQDPKVGDIAVFGAMTGNPYGHTGVVSAVYSNDSFDLLEQNDPTGTPSHYKRYSRANLIGFLRPKKGESMPSLEQSLADLFKIVDESNKDKDRLWKRLDEIRINQDKLFVLLNETNKRLDKLEGK